VGSVGPGKHEKRVFDSEEGYHGAAALRWQRQKHSKTRDGDGTTIFVCFSFLLFPSLTTIRYQYSSNSHIILDAAA
jgi:hypothetical protein